MLNYETYLNEKPSIYLKKVFHLLIYSYRDLVIMN